MRCAIILQQKYSTKNKFSRWFRALVSAHVTSQQSNWVSMLSWKNHQFTHFSSHETWKLRHSRFSETGFRVYTIHLCLRPLKDASFVFRLVFQRKGNVFKQKQQLFLLFLRVKRCESKQVPINACLYGRLTARSLFHWEKWKCKSGWSVMTGNSSNTIVLLHEPRT